jgi:hypothetical protein
MDNSTTQSGWVSVGKGTKITKNTEQDNASTADKSLTIMKSQLPSLNDAKSTLTRKLNLMKNAELTSQKKQEKSYYNLNTSFYNNNINLAQYFNLKSLEATKEPVTYAQMQIKAATYEEKPFKVDYNPQIPDALKNKINRAYITFV